MNNLIPYILLTLPFTLSGCTDAGVGNNKDDANPYMDASIFVQADIPLGATYAKVAAVAYSEGESVQLIGGDVFSARTEAEEKILDRNEIFPGYVYPKNYYRNTLTLNNPSTTLNINVVHAPQETRSDRWYPAEEVIVDTEPSKIVGYSASLSFPEEVEITSPQNNLVYTNRSDAFYLQWLGNPADKLRIISYQSCLSNNRSDPFRDWILYFEIDDNQSHNFTIGDFIPDESPIIFDNSMEDLLTSFVQIFQNREMNVAGVFEANQASTKNFDITYCTIELNLVRQKIGSLENTINDGSILGSRSDQVFMEYRP
ncbi:MAG: hypothetical protein KBT77_15140 [Thalassolituus oleivorans]|uniref:hypothetical protein n=1 Tax=Thalassolituus oleivorans TaxID=187493 RepID=UPI001B4F6ABB|nr:hypothetical protein [Thalassolituus oleivorans]MBQ0728677.1 hypothetical protein [Thalassolituus oleivorans]MBQ0779741.1 hypothetical protein [Thalassolituus oleivorans]